MAKSKMMLNNEWGIMFQSMPDENAGKLIKALFLCHEGKDVAISDPMLSAVFNMMASIVIENDEKYEERCKKNAQNRSKTIVNDCEGTSTNDNDRGEIKRNKNKRKENKDIKEKEIQEKESPAKAEPLMVASREIVNYLNEKTHSNYKASSRNTVSLIKARMAEGHTTDDFKKVIDVKSAEWLGTDQEQYLRPETLFCAKHFESYLNQKMPKARSGTSKSIDKINQTIGRTGSAKEQNDALVRQLLAGGA